MNLEKAFVSTPATDIVLANRNGEPKVLGKPADSSVVLSSAPRTLRQRTLSSQVKNQFCLLWISLLS